MFLELQTTFVSILAFCGF